jgi:predicted small secreted protein
MKTVYFLAGVPLTLLLAACATFRGAGDVDQGRQALLAGDYQRAVGLFQDAERVDPTYIYGTELRGGSLELSGQDPILDW